MISPFYFHSSTFYSNVISNLLNQKKHEQFSRTSRFYSVFSYLIFLSSYNHIRRQWPRDLLCSLIRATDEWYLKFMIFLLLLSTHLLLLFFFIICYIFYTYILYSLYSSALSLPAIVIEFYN